jgi:hypothetical protein
MPVGCPPERRWCVLGPELGPTPFINDTQPASTGAASIVVLSRPAARSHEVPVLSASGPCPRDNDCLYGKADAKGLRRLNDTSMTVTAAIDTAVRKASTKKDGKTVNELSQKIETLEKTLGPEYVALLDGLQDIVENDLLGAEFTYALASLDSLCTK